MSYCQSIVKLVVWIFEIWIQFEFDSISHDLIKKKAKLYHVTLDGAGLMQTNDIHSIILLGTSWLIHVAYAADELSALHLMAR